ITVDQTVVEHVGTLVSVVFVKLGVCTPQPEVVAARCHAADHAEHRAGNIRGMRYSIEPGLRTRHHHPAERCAFKAGADLRRSVLESPSRCRLKIVARLKSRGRKTCASHDSRQRERKCEVRREAIPDQASDRCLRTKAAVPLEYPFVETPLAFGICGRCKP